MMATLREKLNGKSNAVALAAALTVSYSLVIVAERIGDKLPEPKENEVSESDAKKES